MKHVLFVPFVNRRDLLDKAIASALPTFPDLILIDNSPTEYIDGCPSSVLLLSQYPSLEVLTPPVPLSCTQTLNWMKREAVRRGADVFLWLHNDAEIPTGIGQQFMEHVEQAHASGRKWGVIYSNYDAFCAFNTAAVVAIGDWDQHLPQYFSDNDYYHRMRKAGYETIASGLHVDHVSSATLHADAARQMANRHFFPAAKAYCREKHGADV